MIFWERPRPELHCFSMIPVFHSLVAFYGRYYLLYDDNYLVFMNKGDTKESNYTFRLDLHGQNHYFSIMYPAIRFSAPHIRTSWVEWWYQASHIYSWQLLPGL